MSDLEFECSLTIQDLEEIEENYESLVNFLECNLTSFSASAFVLQTVINEVNKCKAELQEN